MSVSRSTAPMCSLGARERCCGGLSAAPARCSSPISKETYGGARMASTPSGSTPTPSRQGTTGAPRLKAAVASPATRWISMVPSGAVSLGSPTTYIAPYARVSASADTGVSLICQHFAVTTAGSVSSAPLATIERSVFIAGCHAPASASLPRRSRHGISKRRSGKWKQRKATQGGPQHH